MAPLNFSTPEMGIVNMYQAQCTGSVGESADLQHSYPLYLKILKFHFPQLHKAVIFLNRYLVSTIDDDEKLMTLSANLSIYLAGRGNTPESLQSWKDSHDVIQGLLDDPTMFNTELVRLSSIEMNLYTENLNTDETKFSVIASTADLDDGTKSVFFDVSGGQQWQPIPGPGSSSDSDIA